MQTCVWQNVRRGAVFSASIVALSTGLAAQTIERVSLSLGGGDANGPSARPSLSGDGRFVAFESTATNLVAGDANGIRSDIFLRDRNTLTTTLVSIDTAGQQVAHDSTAPSLSRDGRYVAFASVGLAAGHTDASPKIFVRDLLLGSTSWATPFNDQLAYSRPDLSADGRVLAFVRDAYTSGGYCSGVGARDLVTGVLNANDGCMDSFGYGVAYRFPRLSGDGRGVDHTHQWAFFGGYGYEVNRLDVASGSTNGLGVSTFALAVSHDGRFSLYEEWTTTRMYLRDNAAGSTTLIAAGQPSGASTFAPTMSGALSSDGAYLAYTKNGDAFLRERQSGAITQINLGFSGSPGQPIFDVALSADASVSAFDSWAANLVAGDANGAQDVFVRVNCEVGATYCTTSTTSSLCAPSIGASGTPSTSASSGYLVHVQQVEGQRTGLIFYALAPAAVPWAVGSSSTLCVGAPRQRTSFQSSGGTNGSCDGALSIDLLSWIAAHPGALGAPLSAGQMLYFQGFFRDPPAPKGSNLSDGWVVSLCP